jgi:hypothetical protein
MKKIIYWLIPLLFLFILYLFVENPITLGITSFSLGFCWDFFFYDFFNKK